MSLTDVFTVVDRTMDVAKKINNAELNGVIADLKLALADVKIELAQYKEKVLELEGELKRLRNVVDLFERSDQFLVFGLYHFLRSDGPGRRPLCPKCGARMSITKTQTGMGYASINGRRSYIPTANIFRCSTCKTSLRPDQGQTTESVMKEADRIADGSE